MKNRYAFTMIELVFVIVILGILAGVAVPRIAATRDDAEVSKIRSDIASIRSAIISERQMRLLRGQVNYIDALDQGVLADADDVPIFDGNGTSLLLQYPIYTAKKSAGVPVSGKWLKTGANVYSVSVGGSVIAFTYTVANGRFDCNHATDNCQSLTK